MPQVVVTIDGKTYRMGCAEGEEEHLEELALEADRRISELRASFGEIGDQRLTVMMAMTVLDELQECRQRVSELERGFDGLREARDLAQGQIADAEARAASRMEEAAAIVERIAGKLETGGRN